MAESDSSAPDWGADSPLAEAVSALHEELRNAEEADDISPEVQQELGKILFKKKTVTDGGFKRQYVASREETVSSIKKLLQRRWNFMEARGLRDAPPASVDASQPVGASGDASQAADGRYLFTQEDRRQLMQEWKTEFHATPEQVEQQKRDSWKPNVRPAGGGDWGRNNGAVRSGKHSRFARHLQLEAGSKAMAELIIYAGRFDPEFLSRAHDGQDRSGASQSAAERSVQMDLKRAAAQAKLQYRKTCILRRKLEWGQVDERHLDWWERENLQKLEDGSLLRRTNEAVAAFGHGTLRQGDERVEIGGSTGGVTRFLLDGYAEPDVATFLARR